MAEDWIDLIAGFTVEIIWNSLVDLLKNIGVVALVIGLIMAIYTR